jgi:hypothetical protein
MLLVGDLYRSSLLRPLREFQAHPVCPRGVQIGGVPVDQLLPSCLGRPPFHMGVLTLGGFDDAMLFVVPLKLLNMAVSWDVVMWYFRGSTTYEFSGQQYYRLLCQVSSPAIGIPINFLGIQIILIIEVIYFPVLYFEDNHLLN